MPSRNCTSERIGIGQSASNVNEPHFPFSGSREELLEKLRDQDEQIHRLRAENETLRIHGPPEEQAKAWNILHRVTCEANDTLVTYLDPPDANYDKDTKHSHWFGRRRIISGSRWEKDHASTPFVVYVDYSCAKPRSYRDRYNHQSMDYDESDNEIDAGKVSKTAREQTATKDESVKILSADLQDFLHDIFTSDDGLKYYKQDGVFEDDSLQSPYHFFHHFRNDIMEQCRQERYCNRADIADLLRYLQEAVEATCQETDQLFRVGTVDLSTLQCLFRPGDLICIMERGEKIVRRQESLMLRRDHSDSLAASFECTTSGLVFDGSFRRVTQQERSSVQVPSEGSSTSIQSLEVKPFGFLDADSRKSIT